MPADLRWRVCEFAELSAPDLHDILRLRQDVFVLEQTCLYADIDGDDPRAAHLFARAQDGSLLAYARLFAPTPARPGCLIGRVVTAPDARGDGLGGQLLTRALEEAHKRFPEATADIAAQTHLTAFYARYGFAVTSEPYLEDGIMHVDMRRPA